MKRQQPPVWKLKLGIALSFTGFVLLADPGAFETEAKI